MKLTRYIVIRDGHDCRIVNKTPKLLPNEIALKLTLDVPEPPKIVGEIEIKLPDPPPVDAARITLQEWIDYQEEEE